MAHVFSFFQDYIIASAWRGFIRCLLLMGVLTGFVAQTGQAQELRSMTITPDESPESGVFLVPEYPDAAYIIISSNIFNLAFSSNMNGIIEERNLPDEGVYRLIIQPFTQFITVTAPGFMQGRFRVATPDAKASLFYRIETETTGTDLLPVNFIVEGAEGANLLLDGQEIDYSGTVQLDPGPYEVRIEQSGYRAIEDAISINSENTLFRYQLEQLEEEPLTIRSTPANAAVYINGTQRGSTTFQDFFFPGEYLVRLTKDGYRDLESQIIVEEGAGNNFSFELERFAGSLQLSVVPANAQVSIGGRDFTRQQDISLPPGTHRVVVEREGYYSAERIIEIEQAGQLSLNISLEPRVGTIRFATQSPEAQFRLFNSSGELIAEWSGINLIRDIPAGRYEYRGRLEGYRELAGQLVVRENETTRVNAQLIEAQRSSEDQQRKRNINEQVPPGQGATTIQPSPQRPSAGDENPQQDGSREDEDEILTVVEEMPQMRGGQAALYEALEYPRRARIYNIEGRVIIQFVVDQQGNVSNIEVVRSVDDDLDEAAIEAMRNMTFSPGMQGGRPVRVRMVQPVIFRLQ